MTINRLVFGSTVWSVSNYLRRFVAAIAGIAVVVGLWSGFVLLAQIPPYILPSPKSVVETIVNDWSVLGPALWVTAQTTLFGLFLAVVGGACIAVVIAQSRLIEMLIAPFMVFMQVTPIVAVAPLILIYAPNPQIAQLQCVFLVAFFPIVVNTLQGFKSTNRDLADTVRVYTASRWTMLVLLQVPSALPTFFAGLKVGGGLALVGAVVAEFTVGTAGTNAGLAFRLLEAQSNLNTPRLFAAVMLLALLGASIFFFISVFDRFVLRHWYASKASNAVG
ncbi:ABC transporter permease [Agrobacterium sp. fls2-241-TYG-188a]|uniref:ABC transporter permease n=1 Tax=Agrobacterium sp. fls2-241-TYG-188a TaxID=3040275 RepID=UPI00254A2D0C|nr:ABC transporter permease [Agrobacterium sp. fls2-241-TYG-188a]